MEIAVVIFLLLGACTLCVVIGHRAGHDSGFTDGMKYESERPSCKYCHTTLPKNQIYLVRQDTGLLTMQEAELYDAIDCERCGCQNIIGRRYRGVVDEKSGN